MKNTLMAIATLAFSFATLVSIRSPLMPLFATAGAASGAHLLTVHPASKSRQQRQLEAEAEKLRKKIEEERNEKLAVVEQRSQLVETTRVTVLSELDSQSVLLEKKKKELDDKEQRLQQYAIDLREQTEQHRQLSKSLAIKTLNENYKLRQPDLPDGATYEDMVAREICQVLYTGGVIVKNPFVRPFSAGFDMTFSILPCSPDFDERGEEVHYVQSIGEAYRQIQKDLLNDIQAQIYAADRLPEIKVVYNGLSLKVYINHFQGQYPIDDKDEKPLARALISEHGMAGAIANEISDYFFANGIRLDFVDVCQYSESEAICWFEPEFKGKLHKIQDVLSSFQSHINNKVELEAEIESDGKYVSILWTTSVEEFLKTQDKDGKEIVIEEPEDANWFSDIIADPKSVHHLIHGPTGAGKSVLVDNICCIAGDDLSALTGKQVSIVICDPKYPDSTWTYRGKRIKPKYREWKGALEGVLAMNKEVSDRIAAAASAADKVPEELFADPDYVLPLPERSIELWVVDEAAALHERNDKVVGPAFRETAWVARSALVKMILVGQNSNCSNYGLQIPDLANFARWYLGITALEALDKVIKPPRELKAKLKAQIYARLKISKQKKRQGIKNPKEQYFALIWTGSEEPFVAQMPAPKAYADGVGAAVIQPPAETIEELIEQAKKSSADSLNKLWENSEQLYLEQIIAELPQYLKDVYEFAQDKDTWIATRDFVRGKNAYKSCKAGLVEDWFNELETKGVGKCDRTLKALRYHWNPPTDNGEVNAES